MIVPLLLSARGRYIVFEFPALLSSKLSGVILIVTNILFFWLYPISDIDTTETFYIFYNQFFRIKEKSAKMALFYDIPFTVLYL